MKRLALAIFITLLLSAAHAAKAEGILPRGDTVEPRSPLTLTYQDKKIVADGVTVSSWKGSMATYPNYTYDIVSWRLVPELPKAYAGEKDLNELFDVSFSSGTSDYDPNRIYQFLKRQTSGWATPPQEPILEIKDNRAVKFVPPQDGLSPNLYATTFDVIDALRANATSTDVHISTTTPTMALGQTNTLGINELIAQGVSNYKGSPANRRHNIKVGVEKVGGIVVAPGEEFSFNKFLGPVDGKHGFLPELVIKATGTVPEFGGGLCQVSSTVFRGAMQAGFPITQRRNHAYAVQYYAPQGTDATIYPGVIDLKFVNDSPGHVLIWPHIEKGDTLVYDFYGTKDNRQVTLEDPVQYDKKPSGAMKATWVRHVAKNGTTTTDTFKSTYASPALYHKTETFPATAPPEFRVGTDETVSAP